MRGEAWPFNYGGQLVYPCWERAVRDGTLLTVRFLRATPDPVQAVIMSLDARERPRRRRGRLRTSGAAADSMILWRDASPEAVEIEIAAPRTESTLRVTNAWRDFLDAVYSDGERELRAPVPTTMFGLRWAGMLIEEADDHVLLRCSDGIGPRPDFDDLVVEIELKPPSH